MLDALLAWIAAAPWFLVAAAILFLPGLALAAAARLPRFEALAASPALSIAVLGVSSAGAALLGARWSLVWVLGLTLLGPVCVWAATRRAHRERSSVQELSVFRDYLVGITFAGVMLGVPIVAALTAPDAIAQRYDTVFHLNATHHIAATGHGAPWQLTEIDTHALYPTGWHLWNALLMNVAGVSAPEAAQMSTLVVVLLGWPVATAWLVETWFRPGRAGRFLTGTLSLSSVAFPLGLLDWGTLYANLLGFALVPVVLASGWRVLGRAGRESGLGRGLALFVGVSVGALVAHPNSILAAGALLLIPATVSAVRAVKTRTPLRRSVPLTAMVLAAVLAFPVLWLVAAGRIADKARHPFLSLPHALGEVILGGSLGKPPAIALGLGLLVGIVVMARRGGTRELLASFALVAVAYVVLTATPLDSVVAAMTSPFYDDPYRIAAIATMLVVPFSVLGWDTLASRLSAGFPKERHTWVLPVLSIAVLLGVLPGFADTRARLSDVYRQDGEANVLTPSERALVERVGLQVPEGEAVVVDPWQGGSLVMSLGDRPVSQVYMSYTTDTAALLNASLRDAAADPRVCEALERLRATHALVLEPRPIESVHPRPENVGLTELDRAEGFLEVDRDGDSVLYRITACG